MTDEKYEISDEMAYNLIQDFRKREIDPKERSEFIRAYMKNHNIGLKRASKILGIPKTTVHDWLMYEKVSTEKLKELEDKGHSKTQIYRALQENRVEELNEYSEFDALLRQTLLTLKPFMNGKTIKKTEHTNGLLHDLKTLVYNLEHKMSKDEKK